MPASVAPERSEVVFGEDSVGSAGVGYGVDSEVVSGEGSKARVLVVISLKTYTQTTLALINSSRPVGYEWTASLALPPVLLLSTVPVVMPAALMQNRVNK